MARKVCGALLGVALAVGVGAAVASIPDADGVIHACRKIDGGRLRAVVSASRCREGERPLKWNVRGPQGEPGPALASFDALAGLPCTVGTNTGSIALEYDPTTGDARIRCVLTASLPAVRVNEFSTGIEGALTDEFVEVVNAGGAPVDLSGFRLVYRSATGTADVSLGTFPDGTTLAPGAFFLFGGGGYAGAHPPDQLFTTTSLGSAGGGVAVRDPSGALVDSVGWGTATNAFVEGTAAPAPTVAPVPGRSDARRPDGADTNDNAADFSEGDPTPGAPNL
jgi:Lamin Tail Domain